MGKNIVPAPSPCAAESARPIQLAPFFAAGICAAVAILGVALGHPWIGAINAAFAGLNLSNGLHLAGRHYG